MLRKTWLRLTTLMTAVAFMLCAVPSVYAQSESSEEGFVYEVKNGEAIITEYTGNAQDLTIPATIDEYPVTQIGSYAFSGCESLLSVTIPATIDYLSEGMFSGCSSLRSVSLPDTIESIDYVAFFGCESLEEINLPSTITTIEIGAFYGCSSLTEIALPADLTLLQDWVFYSCTGLESIILPQNLRGIGTEAFADCTNLQRILIPSATESISDDTFTGCNQLEIFGFDGSYTEAFAKEKNIPFSVFDGCGDVNIDWTVNIKDATSIQKHAASIITLEEMPLAAADFNLDKRVNVKDATAIQKSIAGIL